MVRFAFVCLVALVTTSLFVSECFAQDENTKGKK